MENIFYNLYKVGLAVLAVSAGVKSEIVPLVNSIESFDGIDPVTHNEGKGFLNCVDIIPTQMFEPVDGAHFDTCEQGKTIIMNRDIYTKNVDIAYSSDSSLKISTLLSVKSEPFRVTDYNGEEEDVQTDEIFAAAYGKQIYVQSHDGTIASYFDRALRFCTLGKISHSEMSYEDYIKPAVCNLLDKEGTQCDELEESAKEDVARPTPFIYIP